MTDFRTYAPGKGVNLSYVIEWEDNHTDGILWITYAVAAVGSHGIEALRLNYYGEDRQGLLAILATTNPPTPLPWWLVGMPTGQGPNRVKE